MQNLRLIILLLLGSFTFQVQADRIKDLTDVAGVRSNQLIGFGLVSGLSGSGDGKDCLLYTSPSPRDGLLSRMPSSA